MLISLNLVYTKYHYISTTMTFPSHIFKAYDIRGLVEGELSEELAYRVGSAFVALLEERGVQLGEKKIVVGYDMRLSSSAFHEAVARGIIEAGVDVVDIGLSSTPLFNFACAHYPEHAGGIMVTASHNPAPYNGFKMTLGNGLPVGRGSGMETIRRLCERGAFSTNDRKGTITKRDVMSDYRTQLFTIVHPSAIAPLKFVVDAGNGMAKVTLPEVLEELPVTVDYLYLEPDGTFPNHEANPLKVETLKDLQKKVIAVGADFGFALDGDADRVGIVDEKGNVVDASFVGALIGLEVLRDHPQSLMLYDLRSSQIIPDVWHAAGASVEKSIVGHALIKRMMKEKHPVFASELSLHLYYQDLYDVESSDLSLLYLLRLLSREKKPLSEIIAPLKKYVHSGEINFTVDDKEGTMKKVEEQYKNDAVEISHLDGVWMKFDWGWLSVRASNTEPVLRLNLEARTEEEMKERVGEVRRLIEER